MIGRSLSKQKDEEAARLEAQGDAILDRDAQLLRELGEHAEALKACYEELLRPRNDPAYLRTLEDHEKDRTLVANVTAAVHHVIDGGRSWLSVGMTDQRDHASTAEAARVLGRHLEAPVIRHEDPKDATRFADRPQRQPPKHTFGREKRSKPK
jgi:lipopolysaccharide biosynthesis regulator YciM